MKKDLQYVKFSAYGFLKNLKFFDPFLILFFREMGISFFQIGILYSVREIATNLTEIPTGILADSWGRRLSMVLAFGSYILSFLVFYFLPGFGFYLGAMVLFALGESFRSGTHKAMIMEYLKQQGMADQRVEYYGHTRGWSQKGSALSSLIAAFLVFFSGSFRSVFLWSIIPYILGGLLILTYPRSLDFSCDEDQDCENRESLRGWRAVTRTLGSFLGLFTSSTIRRTLINSSVFDASFKAVKDYIQPILKTLALSLPLVASFQETERVAVVTGIMYSLLYLLSSAASSRSGRFHSAVNAKHRALNGTYLFGVFAIIGIGLFLLGSVQIGAVVLFIAFYVVENLRRPGTLGVLSEQIKGSVMASGLSGESQLKTLLVAVISPLFGLAADRLGLGWAMLSLAAIPLAVYPWVYFRSGVDSPDPQASRRPDSSGTTG
ncbi:MFS transporter [Spirochaeta lutea]|uniref:MFS transporter n=1 Tax=Spirochaeta lutea TaxID=1480694 RepID=UPI0009DCC229|nr:MFS transporter [Spirochaeta lutea]